MPAAGAHASPTASSFPERRTDARAVWTGDAMIVWGGLGGNGPAAGGGVYRPRDARDRRLGYRAYLRTANGYASAAYAILARTGLPNESAAIP